MGGGQPGEMGELRVVASERTVHGDLGTVSAAEDVVGARFLVDFVVSSAWARAGRLRGVR